MILEAAVFALPENAGHPLEESIRDELESADAVLFGPGFDDAEQTRTTLLQVAAVDIRCLVLDAFALGILPDVPRAALPATLILNPNEEEAAILLGRPLGDDRVADVAEIADRFDAVVNCYGTVAAPHGDTWRVRAGGPGLGTSGSGDVLAGAITGFAARGVEPARAAVWGSWTHARAGDRLTERTGIGFLARDLAVEVTAALAEVHSLDRGQRCVTSTPLRMLDARSSVSLMTVSKQETAGMRIMFWTWMIVIAGGLAVMIVLPLAGR